MARLDSARVHAAMLLGESLGSSTIFVFWLETRLQMATLLGRPVSGFAEPASGTVLLVTNPEWRAFERHEVMHVIAEHSWGDADASADWLREGLAQFADGHCGGWTNEQVATGVAARFGWIPLDSLVSSFRTLPDLRAYLEAATVAGYLHRTYGTRGLRAMWSGGPRGFERETGVVLSRLEHDWQEAMASLSARPGPDEVTRILEHGCG